MSGIAGIVERDDAPVDPAALRALIDALSHRGDGPPRLWRGERVGLAHVLRAATPEAEREQGPHASIAGARIVFDGRLDNRHELIDVLASDGFSLREATDADLVLAAYARWEDDCAIRLFGDFAFAIWDARRRRLFCARDILGMRPFCYARRGARLAFASEAHALIRAGLASTAVDEGMVGEYLSALMLHKRGTLFRDITRLEAAHTLVVNGDGVRTARYWHPDPAFTIRYRHDAEYADHLRELLRDAVRRKLRSRARVAVMLSGGLDSSAILGAACSLDPSPRIEALSASFPGLACDETPFSARMTGAARVPARVMPATPCSPAWLREQARRYLDVPDHPNGAMFEGLKRDAVARGVGVLLFGCGGDEWFTGSVYRYGDWIRRGRLLRIATQIPQLSRTHGWRRSLVLATRVGIWPTMPRRLRDAVRRLLGRMHRAPAWIDRDFARRIDLPERLRWELPAGFPTFAQADTFRTATSGINAHSDDMEDRSASRAGLEQRHPFYDRRLVEFGLAIPEDQRCRGACTKYVLREAARPWVPAVICDRLGKAEFSDPFVETLRACGGAAAFRSLQAVEAGWVNGTVLSAMYEEMERAYAAKDPRYCWLSDPLWMTLGIESWLSALRGERVRTRDALDRRPVATPVGAAPGVHEAGEHREGGGRDGR